MKFNKLIVSVLATTLFFSGCGEDPFSVVLDVDPPEHVKQLTVHCYVDNVSQVMFAGLSESRALLDVTQGLDGVDDGAIALYQDGAKLFDFELSSGTNDFVNYQYDNAEPFGVKEGVIELRASAPGYPDLVATQTFPDFVPVTDVKFEEDGTIDIDGSRVDAVEVTFTDPPGVENFYELGLVSVDSSCLNGQVFINRVYFETQDLNAESSGDYNGILLSDVGFDGQEYKIILGVYGSVNNGQNLSLQWKSITKEHFQYSRSLRAFNDNQDFGGFGEPVSIFSNVENGLGIFTCSNQKLYPILLSDIEIEPNILSAVIDGEVFEPCDIQAYGGGEFNESFSLYGYDGEKTINIFITELEVGPVDSGTNSFQINYYNNLIDLSYTAFDGDGLEITEHNAEENFVTGTFTGTLRDFNTNNTIEVENLIFEVTYED